MKKSLAMMLVSLFAGSLSVASELSVGATRSASAVIRDTKDSAKVLGQATLRETAEGLYVKVDFENAPPGKHGFHIHEGSSCAEEGKAAGGHYNPDNLPHGHVIEKGLAHVHPGDFGNVEIGPDGKGKLELTVKGLTIAGATHNVGGRTFILHDKEDDFGQPTRNAGGRIGCGSIESV